jgi:hypothetical protein
MQQQEDIMQKMQNNLNAKEENVMRNKRKQKLAKLMREWRKKNIIKHKEYKKQWRLKNIEKVKLQEKKSRNKNKEKIKIRVKNWYNKNKEYALNYAKQYRIKNKEKIKIRKKIYNRLYEKRLDVKIVKTLRKRILLALKGTFKASNTLILTGAPNWEFVWKHLESTFKLGMTRENHGKIWQIDHVIPCASFDLYKPEEQFKCFHYSNLQALFVHENLSKGSKILSPDAPV